MNNYMLLGTSRFVFIVFYLLSSPKLSWSAIFPHLENLQLSLRCSVFFILLTSCKCDSRLGCLLTFPWKQWWHMLFNSFSDMTLMVCVETIVIKPRNISRELVKQTYEVCPSREGYYHYKHLCLYKWLIYPCPDSRNLLQTVWPAIWTLARLTVLLLAESTAIIMTFQKWIVRICLSSRCDVTRFLPLPGLSLALPGCWTRIISLEMIILDALKRYAMAWWVIQAYK
jgi:hypothetical protein